MFDYYKYCIRTLNERKESNMSKTDPNPNKPCKCGAVDWSFDAHAGMAFCNNCNSPYEELEPLTIEVTNMSNEPENEVTLIPIVPAEDIGVEIIDMSKGSMDSQGVYSVTDARGLLDTEVDPALARKLSIQ